MAEYETAPDGRVVEVRRSSGMVWIIALLIIVAVVVAAFALGFVNVDQTSTGKLPSVKVETSAGKAPTFDVNTATIDVGTRKATIDVPSVGTKKETVDVPTVTMKPAGNPDTRH